MAQYEAKFTEPTHFALHQAENEACKAFKFERSLKPSIQSKLPTLRLKSYTKIVSRDLIMEKNYVEFQKFKD